MAEAATFEQAVADWLLPEGLEPSAGGAPGFTRYVFRQTSTGVVPTLVEGPIGVQVRCQEPGLPCSYSDLKNLLTSGGPIPEELGLTPGDLAQLVSELNALNGFLKAHIDVNTACAEGYISDRIQTPNMGSHFYRGDLFRDGFNPAQPEIILYALADGSLPAGALGQCRDGIWGGEPMVLVGSAFLLPPDGPEGVDHPAGFTGDLDNWHIHLNLCRGNSEGRDDFVTAAECEARGDRFHPTIGWMMHAWAEDTRDNQMGVFSMWNPSIAPLADPQFVFDTRTVRGDDFPENARQSIVTNFAFEPTIEVEAGQSVYFNNSDSVPHTVSAGTPDDPDLDAFDSGILDPGDNFRVDTSIPGSYSLFCALHPDMTTTLVVRAG
ncbi:MAG: hypothetical protein VX833_06085 [Actinomycetota bacterium]|nr:hypothetical protein [Actinomycetota bacterium]